MTATDRSAGILADRRGQVGHGQVDRGFLDGRLAGGGPAVQQGLDGK
jgi:hypothetical protein